MNLIDEIYNKVANHTSSTGKSPTHLILSRDHWTRLSMDIYPMVSVGQVKGSAPKFFDMIISVIPSDSIQFIEVK
jgi:hypothetical protein